MEYKYHYNAEDDVLSIYNYDNKVKESVQVSEDVVLDFDGGDKVIGIEIFYASELLGAFNIENNKDFLKHLENASLEVKSFRNQFFVAVVLYKDGKRIVQPMPLLRKEEYISPLAGS